MLLSEQNPRFVWWFSTGLDCWISQCKICGGKGYFDNENLARKDHGKHGNCFTKLATSI